VATTVSLIFFFGFAFPLFFCSFFSCTHRKESNEDEQAY
jgi:hypothetical protein